VAATLARKDVRTGADTIKLGRGRDADVGVLQRFERRLGGLVEGAFAKVFKGEVQPVEVASALQREADDRKSVIGEGKVLVPNDYVVELGSHDYARLHPWEEPLATELAAMVNEHAAEQGYSFVGRVLVRLEETAELDTGVFRIRSGVSAGDVVDGGRLVKAGSGSSSWPAAAPANSGLPGSPRLVIASGGKADNRSPEARGEEQAMMLTHAVTVVGRASDADLRLSDPGVSRRHAEIRYEQGVFLIVDLGSTNGLRVNDVPTTRRQLSPGDRIQLGSTTLLFRRDEG
jgi:hypothetical protein